MCEGIQVAGQTFETKKALEERLKAMLHGAPIGVELDEPDHSFLLCVLFRHREAVEKIGPGVRAFRVTTSKYRNRCFEILRVDGTAQEFSYLKCVRGEDGRQENGVADEPGGGPGGDLEPGPLHQVGGPG